MIGRLELFTGDVRRLVERLPSGRRFTAQDMRRALGPSWTEGDVREALRTVVAQGWAAEVITDAGTSWQRTAKPRQRVQFVNHGGSDAA